VRFARLWPERVSRLVNLDGLMIADLDRFLDALGQVPAIPPAADAERASVAAFRDYLARVGGVRVPEAEIRARWRVLPDGRVGEDVTPARIGLAILRGTGPTPLDGVRAPLLAIRAVPGSAAALIPWYHELDPGDRARADRAFPDLQRVFTDGWAPFLAVSGARILDLPDAGHHLYITDQQEVVAAMREFLLAPSEELAGVSRPERTVAQLEALYRARTDSARTRFTGADVQFMTGMIAHHAQAVMISRLAPSHGAAPPVRLLAERIINAQEDEIILMQQWLRDRRQTVPRLELTGTALTIHGAGHAVHAHGMLTDAEVGELDAARAREFDRLFLEYMIKHHLGAITMVDELFGTDGAAQDPSVSRLASAIQADQAAEIVRMRRMLAELSLTGRVR
jgi:uncharacterized protein (DUF305 family)